MKALPCPFCGASPHHGLGKVEHCQLHGEPFQRWNIKCPRGHASVWGMDKTLALREWNTRAPINEYPKGAVSVVKPQGTEETGTDRPAAPVLDEGRLWSFLRDVLVQGGAIDQDYRAGKYASYEDLSSRLDEAARERVEQFAERTSPRQGAAHE